MLGVLVIEWAGGVLMSQLSNWNSNWEKYSLQLGPLKLYYYLKEKIIQCLLDKLKHAKQKFLCLFSLSIVHKTVCVEIRVVKQTNMLG